MGNLSKFFIRGILVLGAVLGCVCSAQARAEEVSDFVQMTCIPEFDYFALHTMTVHHSAHNAMSPDVLAATTKRLEIEEKMFSPASLMKRPYECNSSSRQITVKLEDYIAPHEKGECALCTNFSVVILVNGAEVDRFSAYGTNALETHWVEINLANLLRDCTSADYEDHKSCTSKRISSQQIPN